MAPLNLGLLGKFQAAFGEEPLRLLRTSKVQALLIYLVMESFAEIDSLVGATAGQRREMLMELLWPNVARKSAQDNLRQTCYRLRSVIPDQQTEDGAAVRFLKSNKLIVGINPGYRVELDAAEFSRHLRNGRLEAAAALYRGDFLADFYLSDSSDFEEWAQVHRSAYRQMALTALDSLAGERLQNGQFELALQYAGRQLTLDDLRERAYRQAMEALARLGQRGAALAQYDLCRQKLDEVLCVEPILETESLVAQIQRDEIREGVGVEVPVVEAFSTGMPEWERDEQLPLFVAREEEMAYLTSNLPANSKGKGSIHFVVGGAGCGKTALVTAFARQALLADPDLLVLNGHCRGASGLGEPYLPFRQILTQLAGDVGGSALLSREQARRLWEGMADTVPKLAEQGPDLIDTLIPGSELRHRAATIGAPGAQWFRRLNEKLENSDHENPQKERLFGQITAVLKAVARKRPLLLIIDDLHWTDAASASLLFHLSYELAESHILLLGIYRPEEVAGSDGHVLAQIGSELKRRYGDIWLDLNIKDAEVGRAFIDAYLDSEPNELAEEFRQKLFKHTGGHALFTVELLRAMQERGELLEDEQGVLRIQKAVNWEALPARVEGVIEQRFGRLDADLQEALSVAAVEGETFTAEIVAEIQEVNERDLVRRLSREVEGQHDLITAEGLTWSGSRRLARYRFRHQLFQQYLYQELAEGERIYLHHALGLKLESLAEDARTQAAVLAWHFDQAGDSEKSVPYLLQAGDAARRLYASEEAIGHYERALALLKSKGNYEEAARILMKLGLAHSNAFEFEAAQKAYDESFALQRQGVERLLREELPPAPNALRIAKLDRPQSFDLVSAGYLDVGFFPGLVQLTEERDIEPDMAKSWEILEGGNVYLFHLRDDAFWNDGQPVTAADFVCAWKRMLDPEHGSPFAELLFDIAGAADYRQRRQKSDQFLGFEALDDHTLRVKLAQPAAHFLQVLIISIAKSAPKHVFEAYGDDWACAEHIVSSGPFLLQSWNQESMILDRNAGYYGQFTGNVERVEVRYGLEADNLDLYDEGELDAVDFNHLASAASERASQHWAAEYRKQPALLTESVVFNVNTPPFDDARVRRAFVLATDRRRLAEEAEAGRHNPATGGFVPVGMPGHLANIGLPFDPDGARRLLADAGYPGGRNLPTLNAILMPWYSSWLPRFVFQPWQEILGVTLSWATYPPASYSVDNYFEYIEQQHPHFFQMACIADYPDPDQFLRVALHWHTSWRNERYESLINQAGLAMDQTQRLDLFRQAEEILAQEVPVLPILYRNRHYLVKPWIRNYRPSAIGPNWHQVIIEPH